ILGAYYLLWMLQCVIFGPLREPHHDPVHGHEPGHGHGAGAVPPVGWYEILGLTPLMILIVMIGVYPPPFFERIRPSVAVIAENFQAQNDARAVAASGAGAGAIAGKVGGVQAEFGAEARVGAGAVTGAFGSHSKSNSARVGLPAAPGP